MVGCGDGPLLTSWSIYKVWTFPNKSGSRLMTPGDDPLIHPWWDVTMVHCWLLGQSIRCGRFLAKVVPGWWFPTMVHWSSCFWWFKVWTFNGMLYPWRWSSDPDASDDSKELTSGWMLLGCCHGSSRILEKLSSFSSFWRRVWLKIWLNSFVLGAMLLTMVHWSSCFWWFRVWTFNGMLYPWRWSPDPDASDDSKELTSGWMLYWDAVTARVEVYGC